MSQVFPDTSAQGTCLGPRVERAVMSEQKLGSQAISRMLCVVASRDSRQGQPGEAVPGWKFAVSGRHRKCAGGDCSPFGILRF